MSSKNTSIKTHNFTKRLLQWYSNHKRILPWRQTTDPYKIMVSEFMLQQTQVSRVIPKYLSFLESFPTIQHLAKANQSQVIQHWQGLGYNRRAKFLHSAAIEIVKTHNGIIPQSEKKLLELHGFGPYTANAVLAFAFNKPVIVIDANVKNVLNKVFGVSEKEIPELVKQLVPKENARDFYNALMDIGSAYYKSNSDYTHYPFKEFCKTFNGKEVVPLKKIKQKKFHGSNRWYRGQILKMICEKPITIQSIDELHESAKYKSALTQLISENIVVKEKGKIYLK